MSITPNRGLQPSSSKYLTPCRTFGLKRKTTPKLTPSTSSPLPSKAVHVEKKGRINFDSSSNSSCLTVSPVSKNPIEYNLVSQPTNSSTTKLNRKKLSTSSYSKRINDIPTNGDIQSETVITNSSQQSLESSTEHLDNKQITKEMLKNLIMDINKKSDELEKLRTAKVYSKKHDLKQLQNTTEKWKSTCKEALEMLLLETQKRGHNCNMLHIMAEHNIPPELLEFDSETLEFQ